MKPLGGLLIGVGAVLTAIFLIWGVIVGFYRDQLPALLLIGGAGMGLLWLGAHLRKDKNPDAAVDWRAATGAPPTPAPASPVAAAPVGQPPAARRAVRSIPFTSAGIPCANCGATTRQGAGFCGECGARIVAQAPNVSPSAGAPAPASAPAPAAPAIVPPPPGVVDSPALPVLAEEARAVSREPAVDTSAAWELRLPDGTRVAVAATTVFGREPSAESAPGANLVALADSTRSVSKSHLLVSIDGDTASVSDLGSTNGVAVVRSDGTVLEAANGAAVSLEDGDEIELGEYVIEVSRL